MRNPEKEAIVGQPVVLEFERTELNRESLKALMLAECQHYKDLRMIAAQDSATENEHAEASSE